MSAKIKKHFYYFLSKLTRVNLDFSANDGLAMRVGGAQPDAPIQPVSVKGTVSVISSCPLCKDGNIRFTTVPLNPLSEHKCGRYRFFLTWLDLWKNENNHFQETKIV